MLVILGCTFLYKGERIDFMKTFKGGVHVPDRKSLSENIAIDQMPQVSDYYVALSQHIGKPAELVVSVGDTVSEGQLLAKAASVISANIHSPVCGQVLGVEKIKNARGVSGDYIHIKSDGRQEIVAMSVLVDPTKEQIVQRIADAGIVGLGGAGFPTAVKVSPKEQIDTLIINGAECEPYLNCDNRLIIERAKQVVDGARLLAKACGAKNVFVGVEINKSEAYSALLSVDGVVEFDKFRKNMPKDCVYAVSLKTKYPQGAEKMLVKACVNRVIPVGALPSAVGCVICNVGTAFAVWNAVVNGLPLTKRVMTLAGNGIDTPCNLEVRIGTPFADIVEFCGGLHDDTVKLVSGGPMMGFSLINTEIYTTKTDGGLLALTDKEVDSLLPTPCINCGRCAGVCPMKLMPMYIDFYTASGDTDQAVKYGAMNCFECGACAYICPAHRPIVQSVRLTKQRLREKK